MRLQQGRGWGRAWASLRDGREQRVCAHQRPGPSWAPASHPWSRAWCLWPALAACSPLHAHFFPQITHANHTEWFVFLRPYAVICLFHLHTPGKPYAPYPLGKWVISPSTECHLLRVWPEHPTRDKCHFPSALSDPATLSILALYTVTILASGHLTPSAVLLGRQSMPVHCCILGLSQDA